MSAQSILIMFNSETVQLLQALPKELQFHVLVFNPCIVDAAADVKVLIRRVNACLIEMIHKAPSRSTIYQRGRCTHIRHFHIYLLMRRLRNVHFSHGKMLPMTIYEMKGCLRALQFMISRMDDERMQYRAIYKALFGLEKLIAELTHHALNLLHVKRDIGGAKAPRKIPSYVYEPPKKRVKVN